MRRPADYRKYAEECEQLARKMPEHGEVLLEMAKAWRACMDGAGQKSQAQSKTGMTPQKETI